MKLPVKNKSMPADYRAALTEERDEFTVTVIMHIRNMPHMPMVYISETKFLTVTLSFDNINPIGLVLYYHNRLILSSCFELFCIQPISAATRQALLYASVR